MHQIQLRRSGQRSIFIRNILFLRKNRNRNIMVSIIEEKYEIRSMKVDIEVLVGLLDWLGHLRVQDAKLKVVEGGISSQSKNSKVQYLDRIINQQLSWLTHRSKALLSQTRRRLTNWISHRYVISHATIGSLPQLISSDHKSLQSPPQTY